MARPVQSLHLLASDMVPASIVDHLNRVARNLVGLGVYTGAEALRTIGAERQMHVVDQTDPDDTDGGYVQLWRGDDGRYLTVWFVSEYGAADDVTTVEEWDAARVGFDNQRLGWE